MFYSNVSILFLRERAIYENGLSCEKISFRPHEKMLIYSNRFPYHIYYICNSYFVLNIFIKAKLRRSIIYLFIFDITFVTTPRSTFIRKQQNSQVHCGVFIKWYFRNSFWRISTKPIIIHPWYYISKFSFKIG